MLSFVIVISGCYNMVNCLMRPITLDTLGPLNVTNTHCMFPLPTVLTLQNTRVHISTTYYSDETPYVEVPIYDSFGLGTVLSVPYVNPYDGHIQFW